MMPLAQLASFVLLAVWCEAGAVSYADSSILCAAAVGASTYKR